MVELQPSKLVTWVRFPSPASTGTRFSQGGKTLCFPQADSSTAFRLKVQPHFPSDPDGFPHAIDRVLLQPYEKDERRRDRERTAPRGSFGSLPLALPAIAGYGVWTGTSRSDRRHTDRSPRAPTPPLVGLPAPNGIPHLAAVMTVASLRRGLRHGSGRTVQVEGLAEQIGALVHERQQLRAQGASQASLEQNRLRLVHSQRALSDALVERHLPRSL
jgi:hypothetical protein